MRGAWPLLFVVLLAFVVACDGGGSASTPSLTESPTPTPTPRTTASPSPTPSPTPSPLPTPVPTPAPTPAPASIELSGSQVKQGGFLIVRLMSPPGGLAEVTAYFTGTGYAMLSEGDVWYAYIGLPTWFTVGSYPIEVWTGETLIAAAQLTVTEGGFDFVNIDIPPGPAGLLSDANQIEIERQRVEGILSVFTAERHWAGPWIVPTVGSVTSNFGEHRSINGGAYFPHTGHDMANLSGTPVYASASGVVAMAEPLYLYGNSIIIDHGAGVFSSYNHLSEGVVTLGQFVNQGDLIGYMGSTGLSSGPHLHWEAIVRNIRVDPRHFTYIGADPQ